jgi:hypothetical protein
MVKLKEVETKYAAKQEELKKKYAGMLGSMKVELVRKDQEKRVVASSLTNVLQIAIRIHSRKRMRPMKKQLPPS